MGNFNVPKTIIEFYKSIPRSNKEFESSIKKQYKINTIKSCNGAILFGAQKAGKSFVSIFKKLGVQVYAFSDNNKNLWGSKIDGLKVLPPADLRKYPHKMIIITSKYIKPIYRQLQKYGYRNMVPYYVLNVLFQKEFQNERHQKTITEIIRDREQIEKVYDLLQDVESKKLFLKILRFRTTLSPKYLPQPHTEQYFPGKFWGMRRDEVYVDVGAYTGDTLRQFLKHTKNKFKKYYALEPDPSNFAKLTSNISLKNQVVKKIKFVNLGAGASRSEVYFAAGNNEASTVVKNGKHKIKVMPLDDLCSGESVTTIKMDVEGYEREVLAGAKNIIKSKHPKLAVCVYHRPTDLWKLPAQILRYNSGYKFYLRHHQEEMFETVLYAILQ